MKDLKGTKTEANLQTAFAGESMARNKYTYYASKAKKDGYVQASRTKGFIGSCKPAIKTNEVTDSATSLSIM